MKHLVVLLCVLGVFAATASADRIETWTTNWDTETEIGKDVTITDYIFELEDFDAGVVYGDGDVAQVTFGDVTLAISRPGSLFQFTDLSPHGGPATYGSRSLDPFIDVFNPAPFVFDVTFATPGLTVVLFGIDAGDFGPSDRDEIKITRDNPAEIDNNFIPGFTGDFFRGLPFVASEPSSGQFTASGGSPDLPGSIFWDNVRISVIGVEDLPIGGFGGGGDPTDPNSDFGPGYLPGLQVPVPIPEPGTLALLGAGLVAAALLRRRR